MAAVLGVIRSTQAFKSSSFRNLALRSISTTSSCNEGEGWLSKLLVRRIEPTKEPHSRMLSDKEVIYELQTHNIRPDSIDKYLKNCKETAAVISTKPEISCELVGSWTVMVGDLDQALHVWRYTGGFAAVDKAKRIIATDESCVRLQKERGGYLRSRHLQFLLAFSYWPAIEFRKGSHIYELRSYRLKPGTMIEWGNNWARGLRYRRNNDEAFAAFFSQVGRMNQVHHFWCYENLQQRKETREAAWRNPGWDECVAYTVPLIREMHSRILIPTEFSPTQ